jgi:oxygen-independent coproporphyrinogen-3 oxidase
VFESEQLTSAADLGERIVFGLRMTDGISLVDTGAMSCAELIRTIEELTHQGLIEGRGERIRLTRRGRRLADSVAVALLSAIQ